MLDYFKEIYWIYKGNVCQHVILTPLRDVYFSPQNNDGEFNHGSWSFVMMVLFGVGTVILLFAVMNYINLTVAQTGFRAKEMAARRLLGASRGEIILKLILESTFLCVVAFVIALFLAAAVGARRIAAPRIENQHLAGYDAGRRGLLCRAYRGAGRHCGHHPGDDGIAL